MFRELITNISHLVMIPSFALPLTRSMTRDGGWVELWVYLIFLVRLKCQYAQCVQYIHNDTIYCNIVV